MADTRTHHYIYGNCTCYLTGETIVDTDDERVRQSLAKLLVEERGYAKEEVLARLTIETLFADRFVTSRVDLAVQLAGRLFLIIRYAPGSLVTRERSALAAARVLRDDYRIPLAVVTNGREAELLDSATGKVLATGLAAAIPTRDAADAMQGSLDFLPGLAEEGQERERRVLNSFDYELCCLGDPCILPGSKDG
ncbi:MAG: type I restriction enzyme HsdR N-terminal domain-containing protein [Thermodesulfobacteriota bacterium]